MPRSRRTLELEQAHRLRVKAIADRTTELVAFRYADLQPANLRPQLERATIQAAAIIQDGQRQAQLTAAGFYAETMTEELERGIRTRPIADGIAGTTVDGRRLTEPLAAVAPAIFMGLRSGRPFADALGFGAFAAGRIAGTEAADAAWRELFAQMQVDDLARGWTWVMGGESCAACLAQADGETRPPTQSMARHPGCDCVAAPVPAGGANVVPRSTGAQLFARMTPEQQAAAFRSAGEIKATAVREGRLNLDQVATLQYHQAWRATVSEASLEQLGLAAATP